MHRDKGFHFLLSFCSVKRIHNKNEESSEKYLYANILTFLSYLTQ